jgi:hypothetical protein
VTVPVQIRNQDVVRAIRELASLKGVALTDAVAEAVRSELRRARHLKAAREKEREIDELVRRFKELPKVGPMLTDRDLYDEDGMPR